MKSGALTSCILLSMLVFLLLPTASQAAEYKEIDTEVNASKILTHIESGDDVNLINCSIVGKLDLSSIKLKTVPNPDSNRFVGKISSNGTFRAELTTKEDGSFTSNEDDSIYICQRNLSVIESNIIIQRSIFRNDVDFSSIKFNGSVDFYRSTFNGSAKFFNSAFNGPAHFSGTQFKGPANFIYSTFNDSTYFTAVYNDSPDFLESLNLIEAKFNDSVDFSAATFNGYVDFSGRQFNGPARFSSSFNNFTWFQCSTFSNSVYFDGTFNAPVDFSGSTFENHSTFSATFNYPSNFQKVTFLCSVDFSETQFNSPALFAYSTFNTSADFKGPDKFKKIVTTDGITCDLFRTYYNNEARYTDANNIYYQYRDTVRNLKSWGSLSKYFDIICWISCGYGLKPQITLISGGVLVLLFACIYKTGPTIYKNKNKTIPFRFKFQGPLIYRKLDAAEEYSKVTYWDALLFSIREFTTLGSADWYPKDNFRTLVTLEGLLGYVMLGVFMSTLATIMIRV